MATNNNLKKVSLGAPAAIDISHNQYPHAAITVQTMERCGVLTLHDAADGTRCTSEGAMATAARLIAQLMHERSISASAEGWSITIDVLALADAAVHGGAEHPVQMSLTGADGAAAACWLLEGDATPGVSLSADGVLTLPAACSDTLRIKSIRWDDRDVRAMVTIPVSTWREVADLLVQYPSLAAVLAKYPSLAAVLAEYTSLAAVLAERPALAAVVAEWPMVVNSLVETGKRNWIKSVGGAYCLTDVVPTVNSGMIVDFLLTDNGNDNGWAVSYVDSGAGVNAFGLGLWDKKWVYNYGNYSLQGTSEINVFYHYEQQKGLCKIMGSNGYSETVNRYGNFTCNGALPLFTVTRNGKPLNGMSGVRVSSFQIFDNGTMIRNYVPYVKGGKGGLLDMISLTFIGNGNSAGSIEVFTIGTDEIPT